MNDHTINPNRECRWYLTKIRECARAGDKIRATPLSTVTVSTAAAVNTSAVAVILTVMRVSGSPTQPAANAIQPQSSQFQKPVMPDAITITTSISIQNLYTS